MLYGAVALVNVCNELIDVEDKESSSLLLLLLLLFRRLMSNIEEDDDVASICKNDLDVDKRSGFSWLFFEKFVN